jgi:hypothetical protein
MFLSFIFIYPLAHLVRISVGANVIREITSEYSITKKKEETGLFPGLFQYTHTQNVPGGKVSILGGHSIGHSKQESVYVHVSYSERFPR